MEEEDLAKNYAMYLRKSEDDSQKQVRSIEDQKAECLEFAKRYKIKIDEENIIIEEKSARRSNNRPKFAQLLKDIKKGKIDGLIAWHPDRLARNMRDAGEIIDLWDEKFIKDLKFVSVSLPNDYNGKMILGMNFVIAKQYTDKLSEDVSRGVKRSFNQGKSAGQYKAGYIRNERTGYYEIDETMADSGKTMFQLMKRAWQMRAEGEILAKIAEFLNNNGFKRIVKRNKKEIGTSVEKVRKIFKDKFYYGMFEQTGKNIDLIEVYDFVPMITEEDYLIVQTFCKTELQVPKKHKYPFKGLLVCFNCEKNLTAGAPKGRKGDKYLRYWCSSKECSSQGIRARAVIDEMAKLLEALPSKPEKYFKLYEKGCKQYVQEHRSELIGERRALVQKVNTLDKEAESAIIAKSKSKDDYEIEKLGNRIRKLKDSEFKSNYRIEKINSELEEYKNLSVDNFLNTLRNLSTSLVYGSAFQKDEIANNTILNMTIKDGKIVSTKLKPPFDEMFNKEVFLNGGPGRI